MLFVEKGLVRQFYYKNEKELTEHIGYEWGMIICIESYFKQEPTRLIVEALEPAIVWQLPKEDIERLTEEFPDLQRLYRRIMEDSLIESQLKADTLRFEPAQERYVKLSQRHPEILKRAPLVHIASLLQMTPETLSRVRAALVANK
jgi:CRP-like cAMP-binding protein